MWWVVGVVIWGLVWGFATKTVIDNKGYEEEWFWYGFFFGFVALIVACAKPENRDYSSICKYDQPQQVNYLSYPSANGISYKQSIDIVHNDQLLTDGGWKCSCGKVNARYTSSCSCGKSKSEVIDMVRREQAEKKKEAEQLKQVENMNEHDKVSAIKEYKELLDSGIINQEEFDIKKKQLLGL